MKKHSQRAQRVGEQIQRELASLLREEVKDPRVGPVTITSVEVSPDLSHAKVFFSHLPGRAEAAAAVQALQHTAGYLRRELSHRLQLYSVPQLHFVYDDSIESGFRLTRLIDDALAADRAHPPTQATDEPPTDTGDDAPGALPSGGPGEARPERPAGAGRAKRQG
jgi:ribosome-binding factor A